MEELRVTIDIAAANCESSNTEECQVNKQYSDDLETGSDNIFLS